MTEKAKGRGGRRPGAGRPRNPPILSVVKLTSDPAVFLEQVMNDNELDMKLRTDAAKALMPFKHVKLGEGGKKEERQRAAQAVSGKFASTPPPPVKRLN